jgi:uncharacterized protein (DUF2336 family)
MQAIPSLIDDLEAAVQSGSADKRAGMLRKVTDLFLGNAEQYSREQVDVFGDVMNRLIAEVESTVLPELSKKLAPVDRAPSSVVQRLARHDEITVAAPVLAQSNLLSDEDLAEIATQKPQGHLSAISERSRLAAAVTDILVQRGDTTVLRKLSGNEGASFSQTGFRTLHRRAEGDEQVAANLAVRKDLPPQMMDQLLAKATEMVRLRLAERFGTGGNDLRSDIASLLQKPSDVPAPRDFRLAETIVDKMRERNQLDETAILDFAASGRYEELTVGLARLCSAPVSLIDRIMQNPRYDGVLVACKAFGLHWSTFRAILVGRLPVPPSEAELERARSDFLKLTVATAQRMFRFWLVRRSTK